jgi:cell division protein FtsI (penicillin-binding protein 3)
MKRSMKQMSSGAGSSTVARRRLLLFFWLLAGGVLLWRSAELQVIQGAEWRAEAERQHRMTGVIPAARGGILDRGSTPVAVSHEVFRVSVAPHEVADTSSTVELLGQVLGLTPAHAQRPFRSDRRWVPLPGRFPPSARDALSGTRGVYVERELQRFYPHGELLRGIIGTVIDEDGAGGVEQAFDDHLRGRPGSEVLARDSEGRPIPGESWVVETPLTGGEVVLTLDVDLQEIAREALNEALATTGARGGDVLVTDPRSGEILAMVSMGPESGSGLGAINTPYEPGSTLKPFTVASLLSTGKASLADSVDAGHGQWRVAGRTISDVHSPGHTDLAHALRVSSNVAIGKLAERLTPAEQYEGLRDFGFGARTGIELPGEVSGRLPRPQQWSRQTPASLSIGYEIGVTPLQMAMAYGALANGGTLMEPRLIREVRDPRGQVLERGEPRAVRRVISEEVAREISQTLVGAVEDGTGGRARLATFAVAGKSGTSRAHGPGGYEPGAYYASFAGFFPAEDPQLVVFVKLDRPQGEYYGGATAAPVTRATMEAILAAHAPPLDRGALAAIARVQATRPNRNAGERSLTGPTLGEIEPRFATVASPPGSGGGGTGLADGRTGGNGGAGGTTTKEVSPSALAQAADKGVFLMPELAGSAPRAAARRLHSMGLTVVWNAPGPVRGTDPPAGTPVLPGDTIFLLGSPTTRGEAHHE